MALLKIYETGTGKH